jgi:hypothetical protein
MRTLVSDCVRLLLIVYINPLPDMMIVFAGIDGGVKVNVIPTLYSVEYVLSI